MAKFQWEGWITIHMPNEKGGLGAPLGASVHYEFTTNHESYNVAEYHLRELWAKDGSMARFLEGVKSEPGHVSYANLRRPKRIED